MCMCAHLSVSAFMRVCVYKVCVCVCLYKFTLVVGHMIKKKKYIICHERPKFLEIHIPLKKIIRIDLTLSPVHYCDYSGTVIARTLKLFDFL